MAFRKRTVGNSVPDLTDTWTSEQRQRFLRDWQDEELPMRMNRDERRSYR